MHNLNNKKTRLKFSHKIFHTFDQIDKKEGHNICKRVITPLMTQSWLLDSLVEFNGIIFFIDLQIGYNKLYTYI